jgi:spoIIIJ-associated protein
VLLEEIARHLGLDAEIQVSERDGIITGSLEGEDLERFVGHSGRVIEAVQHLAQRIVFQEGRSDVRVVIDAGGYRARRAQALREGADEAADEVLRSGKAQELKPMTSPERRVVHEYLRDRGDVSTHSEGDEPERYLVISPPE